MKYLDIIIIKYKQHSKIDEILKLLNVHELEDSQIKIIFLAHLKSRFNEILIKIPEINCVSTDNVVLKYICKDNIHRIANTILIKE